MSRQLTEQEVDELYKLKESDIDMNLMKSYFAVKHGQTEPRFHTNDYFMLPRNAFYNSETIKTTIGRFIVNKFVMPVEALVKLGYQNETLNVKKLEGLELKLGTMMLNNEITTIDYMKFLDNGEWITMGCAYFLMPSMDYNMIRPIPEVTKRRDELFLKYSKELKDGDPDAIALIEKELLKFSNQKLSDEANPGRSFFESGEFKMVNYKKNSIMVGAVEDTATGKLRVVKNSYADGIDKDEYSKTTALTILGGYSRGVSTQDGGYSTKKYNAAMQASVLDVPDSDCHTMKYLEITIHPELKDMYLYRYILDDDNKTKLILLDNSNINKYVGKSVKMRSPMYCNNKDKICNKCAGELFYKMGTLNVGLLAASLSGNLMNKSMKAMHDASINFKLIKPEDFINEI